MTAKRRANFSSLVHQTTAYKRIPTERFGTHCVPVLAFLAVTALGCGGRTGLPELATVQGTITLDDEPLQGATVRFQPKSHGRACYGKTDEYGRYELVYVDDVEGALTGLHTVSISTYPERIPARYNRKTELVRDVAAGSNTFDFALEPGD